MKEKTKNNGFSLESLLDTDAALRRAAICAINNMGKIINLIGAYLFKLADKPCGEEE